MSIAKWSGVALLSVLVLLGAFAGELRDPPFDLVRFLFTLLLNGLLAWFLLWMWLRVRRWRRGRERVAA